ncbi:polyprenyl synthetase family protein [Paraconexibacter algicola]|uniref:Heptaprenyl diphosphate synthase n=1 Tax=Paraconexibacter algicola TaxID=2133960 RepID=A0A2T4UJ50_9ACTN|nr:polyprenyl synthetase family protein [Paraconexibacter algicola]PTL59262.1 heptaprenyl diphosphate synthase [Paraconexibacter algicola]
MSATLAAEAAPIAQAAGPHVAPLMGAVEELLGEIAAGTAPQLAPHGAATIAAGGKRLRPLLVLVAAGAPEPGRDTASLVRAAAAVELVHSATLVHDDVLDDAPMRRGAPTVYASAGRAMATCAGDQLFARAFSLLVQTGRPDEIRALSDAGSGLARGELLQRADAWDATVTLDRYLLRCELKTARLFEAACALGVMESGRADADPTVLGSFGRRIGLAFQLLDDVLDVSGPVERTGKHRGTDLLDGTVTLPFIVARERDPQLAALDPRTITTPQQAEEVCDAIAATGALDAAREQALELVAGARRDIPADLPEAQRRALDLVATGVVARYA